MPRSLARFSGDRAGSGLNKTLEITKAVDAMKLDQTQAKTLDVEIIPRSDAREEYDIKVGQITVHRHHKYIPRHDNDR